MISLLTSVTNNVAFSVFSRLQREPERLRRAFYQITQYTSLISFPAFLGVLVLAPELIPAFFGPKWAPSVPVMQILALIGILHSVLNFNGSVIVAAGKPSWRLGVMLLTAVCSVIGFLVAVRWGIVAVAVAFVVSGYLVSPVSLVVVRRVIEINFRTYFRQFVVPLTASLAMVAAVLGFKYFIREELGLYFRLLIYVVAGGLVYLLIVQLTAPSLKRRALDLVPLLLPNLRPGKTKANAKQEMLATLANEPQPGANK
jgi:PST family polysaccharide transporter